MVAAELETSPVNLTIALRALSAATDHVPEEAIGWLCANWDKASVAALQVLARVASDPAGAPDGDLASAYFLLHVCAEKGETKAFPLLISLSKDPAGIDDILGDSQLIVQPSIMISLFDGNTDALLSLLDAPDATVMTKAATFAAMAWLTAAERMDRDKVRATLAAFPQKAEGNPLAGWDGWAMAAALLADESTMVKVREAYRHEDISDLMPDLAEVEDVFEIARGESDPLTVFEREGLGPINDAIARLAMTEVELQEMFAEVATDEGATGEADARAPGEPAANPFRNVGRNDPCPCGSGKKFKKCCGG
jgi:uncharacterized protein